MFPQKPLWRIDKDKYLNMPYKKRKIERIGRKTGEGKENQADANAYLNSLSLTKVSHSLAASDYGRAYNSKPTIL